MSRMNRTDVNVCEQCDYVTTEGDDVLRSHKEQQHKRKYPRPSCPYSTCSGAEALAKHARDVHERHTTQKRVHKHELLQCV